MFLKITKKRSQQDCAHCFSLTFYFQKKNFLNFLITTIIRIASFSKFFQKTIQFSKKQKWIKVGQIRTILNLIFSEPFCSHLVNKNHFGTNTSFFPGPFRSHLDVRCSMFNLDVRCSIWMFDIRFKCSLVRFRWPKTLLTTRGKRGLTYSTAYHYSYNLG